MATADSAKHAEKKLGKWMKPRRAPLPFPLMVTGARAEVQYQPLGVVGVVAPWNFPINLSFGPLAGIFAAGNSAMMKLSELAPATADAIAASVDEYYSPEELVAVVGDVDVARSFTALPFDHLIFTGSPAVAHHVMRAAADHLVPVTLELGGKCPTIVDKGYDPSVAAKRILIGKAQNAGQICLAPDTIFVHHDDIENFITASRAVISSWFTSIEDNADYVSMINKPAFDRMKKYLEEARQNDVRIEVLGPAENSEKSDKLKTPPAFIIDPDEDLAISNEEIFGPLMVLRTFREVDEIISYLKPPRDRPLAIYYFSKDRNCVRRLRDRTVSGGLTVNDIILHAAMEELPLGGVGNSGMGAYHGETGFKTFSHARGVLYQGLLSPAQFFTPPYTQGHSKMVDRSLGPMDPS